MTRGQQAIRELAKVMREAINLDQYPAIFANGYGPIVRNTQDGRELAMARWGMPTPAKFLEGKNYDSGVTNVRNVTSPYWRKWLGVENRCVVPFTSFSEFDQRAKQDVWFATSEERPLQFFAGIWQPQVTAVRKVKEGLTTNDLYAFLTCEPNAEVEAVHPKAMPVILTTEEEIDAWMTAPATIALQLQRPLPDGALQLVARGVKKGG